MDKEYKKLQKEISDYYCLTGGERLLVSQSLDELKDVLGRFPDTDEILKTLGGLGFREPKGEYLDQTAMELNSLESKRDFFLEINKIEKVKSTDREITAIKKAHYCGRERIGD